MEPCYSDDHVQLYLGDCREILPTLGLQADVVIADPPYGETSLAWDRWPNGWLDVAAATAPALWCFGSWRVFGPRWGEFTGAGWRFAQDVVWEKHNGSGFAADRFRRVHETITHWYQGPWRDVHHQVPRVPNEVARQARGGDVTKQTSGAHLGAIREGAYVDDGSRLARSVLYARSMNGLAIHPTEKPVRGLLEHLVHYSVPPGGLVVDPFAGSGSALVAARESGRRAVGVEISEEYCEAAAKRLAAIDAQPSLFGKVGA